MRIVIGVAGSTGLSCMSAQQAQYKHGRLTAHARDGTVYRGMHRDKHTIHEAYNHTYKHTFTIQIQG